MLAFMACAESLRRFDTKTPRGDEDNMGQDGTGQIGDLGLVCLKYGIFLHQKKTRTIWVRPPLSFRECRCCGWVSDGLGSVGVAVCLVEGTVILVKTSNLMV